MDGYDQADQQTSMMTNPDQGQSIKEAIDLRLRGTASEVGGRKTGEDKGRFEVRQRLAAWLITEENRQDGHDNTETCQRQAIKTNPVSVDVRIRVASDSAFFLIIIGVSYANDIGLAYVRERMRRLENGNER